MPEFEASIKIFVKDDIGLFDYKITALRIKLAKLTVR